MLMHMPGPRDIVIYWPGPQAFSVVQKPWGWAHILVQKPQGARGGGMVTGQIDTCIKKAFGTIDHRILVNKLSQYGICDDSLKFFRVIHF